MKIRVFGTCTAFVEELETTDPTLLKAVDGYVYQDDLEDDCFGFWLVDEADESTIKDAGISGGFLSFTFDEATGILWASVVYDLAHPLTEVQISDLAEYTEGQCSDGVGSNFQQMGCDSFPVEIAPMTGEIQYEKIGF